MTTNINNIPIYLEVVRQGNFSKASRELGVPLSKVSKSVAALEDDLKVKLLNRTTRKISLTDEGRVFFDLAVKGIDQITGAQETIRDMNQEPSGKIKILLPYSFGKAQMTPVLSDYLKKYPDVSFEIIFSDEKHDLIKEGFDLALVTGAQKDSTYISRKLCSLRSIICCSADYIAKAGEINKPEQLAEHNCILYSYSIPVKQWKFKQNNENHQISVNGNIIANSSGSLLSFLKAGLGIGRLPTFLASPCIENGDLVQLLKYYSMPTVDLNLVYPHRDYVPFKTRALIDHISSGIDRELPHWDKTIE